MRNHLGRFKSPPSDILIQSEKQTQESEFKKQPKLILMYMTFKPHFEKQGCILE